MAFKLNNKGLNKSRDNSVTVVRAIFPCWVNLLLLLLVSTAAVAQIPSNSRLNTGANGRGGVLPAGASDLTWQFAIDSINGNYSPAVIINPNSNYYQSTLPNAQWISFSPSGSNSGPTDIYFKASLVLPKVNDCGRPTDSSGAVCMALDFYAHNSIFQIYINGVAQSDNGTFQQPPNPYQATEYLPDKGISLSLCNNWKAGNNEIICLVKSDSCCAGFLCQASTIIPPVLSDAPNLSLSPTDTLTCPYHTEVLTAYCTGQHLVYLWNTGVNTLNLNVYAPGIYTVTVTDTVNGCSTTGTVEIVRSVAGLPDLSVALPDTLSCLIPQVTLTASSTTQGVTYNWSSGATTSTSPVSSPGMYYVTATNPNTGCNVTDTVPVIQTSQPMQLTGSITYSACNKASGAIQLSVAYGTPPYNYNWSNGANTADINQIDDGIYTVSVTDSTGCKADSTFDVPSSFKVQVISPVVIDKGQTATISATANSNSGVSYSWSPVDSGMVCPTCPSTEVSPQGSTMYFVMAVDTNGCKATDTVTVTVIQSHNVFMPNSFTPNGDGHNDYYEFFADKLNINSGNIKIFDKWGEMVFESSDLNFKWDGTYKGQLIKPQVLVYVIHASFIDGYNLEKTGSITLLR